ncbi:MAG: DUF302 domain-containing protein [Anaerolineae bacterium]
MTDSSNAGYSFRSQVDLEFDDAVEVVTAALRGQGFGVVSEIDLSATLKEKLGVDFRRYLILGACNPVLANRALESEIDIGVLLPCNVVLYEGDEGTVVASVDPRAMLGVVQNPTIDTIADEVRERLLTALGTLRS